MTQQKFVDVDTHMIEPRDLWTLQMDKKYRDRAPRIITNPKGLRGDHVIVEGIAPFSAVAGSFLGQLRKPSQYDRYVQTTKVEDVRPGAWDPASRIKDMAVDGIAAGVAYPTNAAPFFSLRDPLFQGAVLRTYNDWLAEFTAHDRSRLGGAGMVPIIDVKAAVKEVQRIKKIGLNAGLVPATNIGDVSFGHPQYEPLWAAYEDADLPITFHTFNGDWWWQRGEGKIFNLYVGLACMDFPVRRSITEMMFAGVFDRHPKLKVTIIEFHAGWVPHWIWLSDYWAYHRPPTPKIKLKPSEYFKRNMWVAFIDDPVSVEVAHLIGEDRLMWSSDYPHVESLWPHSKKIVDKLFAGKSAALRQKITHDNAKKLYGFKAA